MEKYNKHLLRLEAFGCNFENLTTVSSGLQIPTYCDNRLIFSDVEARNCALESLESIIRMYYPNFDLFIGVSTAGLPHGAILADRFQKPFLYVRPSAKNYGKQKRIEGIVRKGLKALIIEDLIFEGVASLEVVEVARTVGFEVLGVVSLFNYQLSTVVKRYHDLKVSFSSITHFLSLIEEAKTQNIITAGDYAELVRWHKNPYAWKAPVSQ